MYMFPRAICIQVKTESRGWETIRITEYLSEESMEEAEEFYAKYTSDYMQAGSAVEVRLAVYALHAGYTVGSIPRDILRYIKIRGGR